MIKKILLALGLLAFGVGDVQAAANLGAKKATEFVSFFLKAVDSGGIKQKPDSVHIFTYIDEATTPQITLRNTVFPFIGANPDILPIDTTKRLGDTIYLFSDQIQDIDGTPTPPTYVLKINVIFFTAGIPWDNEAYVQVIADSLNEFSKFTSATDSVVVNVTAAIASNLTDSIAFRTWDEILTGGTHNLNNSSGRDLRELAKAGLIHTGQSDNTPANTVSTISLESGGGSPTASTVNNFYNGQRITITSGTGSDQAPRIISDYIGSNQSAVVAPDWTTIPDATSDYSITPANVHAETQAGTYAGGAVFISPNGVTTANIGVDGTSQRPIDDGSLANARLIADALNLTHFTLSAGASITLDANYDQWRFTGGGYSVALGGQSISGSRFFNGFISGVGTGASRIVFTSCLMGDIEAQPFALINCGLTGQVKMSASGAYRIFGSNASGPNGEARISFGTGAGGSQTIVLEDWNGKVVIDSMGVDGTDSLQLDGRGVLLFEASNVAGVVVARGIVDVVDTLGATLTSVDEALAITLPKVASHTSDSAYQKDTASAFALAGSVGEFIKDSLTGASSILAAGQFSKISDSVWLRLFATVAGSYIDSLILASELATKEELAGETADSTLDRDTSAISVANSFGLMLKDTSAYQGAAGGGSDTTAIRLMMINNLDSMHRGIAAFTADSMLQADTAGHNNVAGSMGEAIPLGNFASAATVADTFLNRDTSDISTANSFGLMLKDTSAYQGAASGLTTGAIAEAVLDTMEASETRDIKFNSLVISNSTGDAVQFTSTGGGGDGLQVTGQGAGAGLNAVGGSLGSGFKGAGSTGGDGMELVGGPTGDGLNATGGATSGKGINAIGGGSGAGLNITGGTGSVHSMLITTQNANGNALTLIPAGTGKAIAADIDSAAFADDFWEAARNLPDSILGLVVDSALLSKIVGSMTWGIPFVTSNDSSLLNQRKTNLAAMGSSEQSAIDLQDFADDGYDPVGDTINLNIASGGGGGSDTAAIRIMMEAEFGVGSYVGISGSAGSGSNAVEIGALDTSGVDSLVSGVAITVKTLAGITIGVQTTLSNGFTPPWNLNVDTFIVRAGGLQSDHFWSESFDTIVVVTDPDTFFTPGFDIEIIGSGSPSLCVVYGFVFDIHGDPVKGVSVSALLRGRNLIDTVGLNIIFATTVDTVTNDTGYFQMELIRTSTFNTGGRYYIKAVKDGNEFLKIPAYIVPDSVSHRIRSDRR